MFDLLRKMLEVLEAEIPIKDKVSWFEELIEDTDINAIELMLFSKTLESFASIIQNKVKSDVEALAKEKGTIELFGSKITHVSIDNWDYLNDPILSKYENLYEEKNKELKKLKQSIKNRQETLVDENKAIRTKPKEHIRVTL